MKIKIFYTSHRQITEYKLSSYLFNKSEFFKKNSDILICYNNDNICDNDILNECSYDTKVDIIKVRNSGFRNGLLTSIYDCFEHFKGYDFVIHFHPDVFITDEKKLQNLLEEEINTDNQIIVDYHPNLNHNTHKTYSTDFFIFKPNIYNFFNEVDIHNPCIPEEFLYKMIDKYQIPHRKIYRGIECAHHNIDDYGLIHCHDLSRIKSIIDGNKPNNGW